ncbi:MAG TPA: DUF4012 domain-containing protein [Ktedonobacteraceae bacterium]
MSVTSPDNNTTDTDFSDLLSRHPELAQWLAAHHEQEPDLNTEEVHRLFLEECTSSGISNEQYPFAVDDHGKAALLDYYSQLSNRPMELPADMPSPDALDGHNELPPYTQAGNDSSLIVEETSSSSPVVDDPQGETALPGSSGLPSQTETGPEGPVGVRNKFLSYNRRLRKKHQILYFVLLGIILLSILLPIGFAAGYGITAYRTYTDLRDQAHQGVQHLLNIKTIFTGIKTHPTGFLDTNKLHRAQKELSAAYTDFQQLQQKLDHSSVISNVATFLPQYLPQIKTARAASQIGIDATNIGQELVNTAEILAPNFRGSLLTSSSKPLVTQSTLDLLGRTINDVLPKLSDISAQARLLSLDALPVSAQQRDEFAGLISAIPQAQIDLTQVHNLLGSAGWLLGVDQPRTFLVQTMDRAELRPTGGFTGQYGELQIRNGRVAPFTLKDISLIEYADNSPTYGNVAPRQYRSWWPFANWGLRDSNLSADFPTSAQIAINQYKQETKRQVDGVVLFTPMLIEHVLNIIGPVQVPGYNETITSQNLEERLHYYQQDNAGIAKQVAVQPGDTATSQRKRFTTLLAHLLLDKVRQAPPDELLAVGREMLQDLKTRDLQVYFNNPQVEAQLMQYGDASQLDRSTTHDGLYVVQANISASKASQYVKTILHDTVMLDAQGGATHVLQMRLVYNQLGPVYGYDTYRDYVRIYVPPTSKFLWGNGFDTGTPLCGGSYVACPQNGVYPHDELVCPTGQYQPGAEAPSLTDPSGADWQPLDTIGPPPNLISDEPGRAMFGGWVVVPKNCTMTVTLSWYVPSMGTHPYSLLVQRQAGTFPELGLTILPTPGNCTILRTAGLYFDGILGEDKSFTVKTVYSAQQAGIGCYPQVGT